MKLLLLPAFVLTSLITLSQSTPPSEGFKPVLGNSEKYVTDTINFTPYSGGTIITNQYINDGALFSGSSGSSDPQVYDYGVGSYGAVLINNWYDPIRIDFVDTLTGTAVNLVEKIEFDNPVSSEVDYIVVDVYDASNNPIYHYVSASPENVVIDFGNPTAAYMIVDDSNSTAYIFDNLLLDFGEASSASLEENTNKIAVSVYPNPNTGSFKIQGNSVISEYEICNALGKVVQQGSPNKNEVSVNLNKKGVYFARVTTNGVVTTRRIIVT